MTHIIKGKKDFAYLHSYGAPFGIKYTETLFGTCFSHMSILTFFSFMPNIMSCLKWLSECSSLPNISIGVSMWDLKEVLEMLLDFYLFGVTAVHRQCHVSPPKI